MQVPQVSCNAYKLVKSKKFMKGSERAESVISAINKNSDLMAFCDRWKSKISLKYTDQLYFEGDENNVIAQMKLKYKNKALNKGILCKIKNLFKKCDEVILTAYGHNLDDAYKKLSESIWSNDLSILLRNAECDTISDMKFREKYKKLFGIYMKREG